MKVIGTAGHIDHGKSTLVQRLTGIDPDRLIEEKRRGMTIDLGFAWLTLPSGAEASVVDVPGHERFVKNMLAGAAGVDVALVVVAADEGVMPQTREHLDILDLLGIRHGVVALTKMDLAEPEWLQLVQDDVVHTLGSTSLAGCPVVPVSALTGEGIPRLLAALDVALALSPPPQDRRRPYVPVDRVFTISGFGTVITGTLHDGGLTEGQEVEIIPGGRKSRLRTLQTHRMRVAAASPGTRVAMNLQGVSTHDLDRGDVVGVKGSVIATRRLDAQVRVLETSPLALRHGMSVAAHLGAAERSATLTVLGADEIEPNATGWVQLRFGEPVAATRDQRLIIRLPSPARTVAGGVVADASPRHHRSDGEALARLENLLSPLPQAALLAALQSERPRSIDEAAFRSGLSTEVASGHLRELEKSGQVHAVGERYLLSVRWENVVERALRTVRAYHAENPLRGGISKEELRSRLGWRFADWPEVVRDLVNTGLFRLDGPSVSLREHAGGTSSRRAHADAVLQRLRAEPFSPPSGALLLQNTGADKSLLGAMVAAGEIVRVDVDLYFERHVYDDMVRRIVEAIERDDGVTVATVRDLFGTSRKYALSLLEHLDDEHITRRAGDFRRLGSKAPSRA